jgi:hypothetical protein
MQDSVTQFYDGLAGDYHDWQASVRRQGEVLDCCCGMGLVRGRGYKSSSARAKWVGKPPHHATDYMALLQEEVDGALLGVGLTDIRWYLPEECGRYQPLVTARKP